MGQCRVIEIGKFFPYLPHLDGGNFCKIKVYSFSDYIKIKKYADLFYKDKIMVNCRQGDYMIRYGLSSPPALNLKNRNLYLSWTSLDNISSDFKEFRESNTCLDVSIHFKKGFCRIEDGILSFLLNLCQYYNDEFRFIYYSSKEGISPFVGLKDFTKFAVKLLLVWREWKILESEHYLY